MAAARIGWVGVNDDDVVAYRSHPQIMREIGTAGHALHALEPGDLTKMRRALKGYGWSAPEEGDQAGGILLVSEERMDWEEALLLLTQLGKDKKTEEDDGAKYFQGK